MILHNGGSLLGVHIEVVDMCTDVESFKIHELNDKILTFYKVSNILFLQPRGLELIGCSLRMILNTFKS